MLYFSFKRKNSDKQEHVREQRFKFNQEIKGCSVQQGCCTCPMCLQTREQWQKQWMHLQWSGVSELELLVQYTMTRTSRTRSPVIRNACSHQDLISTPHSTDNTIRCKCDTVAAFLSSRKMLGVTFYVNKCKQRYLFSLMKYLTYVRHIFDMRNKILFRKNKILWHIHAVSHIYV